MLKKFIYSFVLAIVLSLGGLYLSACCSNECQVKITFLNVDPEMGVEDYVVYVKYRGDISQQFTIPEGWEHSGMTVTLNGRAFTDYSIAYKDTKYENEDESEHRYSTEKTISFAFTPVITDLDLVFDMSTVRQKEFTISLDSQLYQLGTPTKGEDKQAFRLMSIKPNHGSNFVTLNYDQINYIKDFNGDNVTAKYGETLLLVYTYKESNANLSDLYSNVTYFTPESKVVDGGSYSIYGASKRGNSYYTYKSELGFEVNANNTRLFYLGKFKEDIKFYYYIPGFVAEKGFQFEKDPNTFYFLSNKQPETTKHTEKTYDIDGVTVLDSQEVEYSNEYLVDISFYKKSKTTVDTYNSNKSNPDTVENNKNLDKLAFTTTNEQTNQTITTYTVIEKMKPSGQIANRYDVYKYYIGDNLNNDNLLTSDQKKDIAEEMYIAVDSELVGVVYQNLKALTINLINYEKEGSGLNRYPYHEIEFNVLSSQSDKGVAYIKVTKELIERYFLKRVTSESQGHTEYNIGSAILYTTMSQEYTDACRGYSCHDYFIMYNRIFYNNEYVDNGPIDYDYKFELMIIDEESKKYNYGFVDHTIDPDPNENHTMFRVTDLYDKNEDGSYTFKNNLYLRIEGPKYVDQLSPTIASVTIQNNVKDVIYSSVPVADSKNYNGVLLKIDLGGVKGVNPITLQTYGGPGGAQTAFNIYLTKNSRINQQVFVDFSGLDIGGSSTVIYATNSRTISSIEDFKKIDYVSYTDSENLGLNIGQSVDLLFFVASGSKDFDIYFTPSSSDTQKLTSTKLLYDIAGNPVVVVRNGMPYNVYVKYLTEDFYHVYNGNYTLYAR